MVEQRCNREKIQFKLHLIAEHIIFTLTDRRLLSVGCIQLHGQTRQRRHHNYKGFFRLACVQLLAFCLLSAESRWHANVRSTYLPVCRCNRINVSQIVCESLYNWTVFCLFFYFPLLSSSICVPLHFLCFCPLCSDLFCACVCVCAVSGDNADGMKQVKIKLLFGILAFCCCCCSCNCIGIVGNQSHLLCSIPLSLRLRPSLCHSSVFVRCILNFFSFERSCSIPVGRLSRRWHQPSYSFPITKLFSFFVNCRLVVSRLRFAAHFAPPFSARMRANYSGIEWVQLLLSGQQWLYRILFLLNSSAIHPHLLDLNHFYRSNLGQLLRWSDSSKFPTIDINGSRLRAIASELATFVRASANIPRVSHKWRHYFYHGVPPKIYSLAK